MQRITVAEITITKDPKGQWTKTTITDDKGGQFSGFDTKLTGLSKGAIIDVEPEVKGKYINIKEWKLIEETAKTEPEILAFQASTSVDTRALIIAQLWIAGKIDEESGYVQWLKSWLPIKQRQPGAAKTESQTDKSFEEFFPDEVDEPITVQKLLEFVSSKGKAYNRTWLIKTLGIDDATLDRDPKYCYLAITELMGWPRELKNAKAKDD